MKFKWWYVQGRRQPTGESEALANTLQFIERAEHAVRVSILLTH
jgi:hypothetical protein